MLSAQELRTASGSYSKLLMERAEAVHDHLVKLEPHLPDPPSMTQDDHLRLRAAIIARAKRSGVESSFEVDQQIAWWKRVEKTSSVGTTLSRIRPDDAMNLILQGYYLTMSNMHIANGWPLTMDLQRQQIEELFRDASVSM